MNRSVNIAVVLTFMVLMIPVGAYAVAVRDLADMLTQLQTNIPAMRRLVIGFCYMFGFAMVMRAVFKFKRYGEMRTMMASNISIQKPMIVLFVGCGLLLLPTLIDSAIDTFYDYGSSSVMEYPAATSWSAVINPLIQIVKLLGLIVFVKGWIMLGRFGGEGGTQPGMGGKAVMHMIGGVLAMNIVGTIDIIKGTFGI